MRALTVSTICLLTLIGSAAAEKLYGPEHGDVALCLNNLAMWGTESSLHG